MSNLILSQTWQNLLEHKHKLAFTPINSLFEQEPDRWRKFTVSAAGIFLDYSKNLIDPSGMRLLSQLAEEADLKTAIKAMFSGEAINNTEWRPVLHTALRDLNRKKDLIVGKENITRLVQDSLKKMDQSVNAVRLGKWRGATGKSITNVVNIGIGGSHLGPNMVVEALKPYASTEIKSYFVSNIDSSDLCETLKKCDAETTLFIVASKTFTTQETLCNTNSARAWMKKQLPKISEKDLIRQHFIAVTARPERAEEFGIDTRNIFPFWDWVGGRFSLWSAIGISIAFAIGMDNFRALLFGAYCMDQHFLTAPFSENVPVILALVGIWHINFCHLHSLAVLPYDQYLSLFPAYLQQLDMESNGKSVTKDGKALDYATAPVVWGSVGTNGQHAFHQLLMQGTEIVPVDFILPIQSQNPLGEHHNLLAANCFAQAQALMQGRGEKEIIPELKEQGFTEDEIKNLLPHKIIAGNHPSNMLLMDKLTPERLGALIALYEHKIFVQGVIWRINSFDQWGVELGKKLTNKIAPTLLGKKANLDELDQGTRELIKIYNQKNPHD